MVITKGSDLWILFMFVNEGWNGIEDRLGWFICCIKQV
jgi:hypothetical protein